MDVDDQQPVVQWNALEPNKKYKVTRNGQTEIVTFLTYTPVLGFAGFEAKRPMFKLSNGQFYPKIIVNMDTGSVHEPKNEVDIEAYVDDQMVDGGRKKRRQTKKKTKQSRRRRRTSKLH